MDTMLELFLNALNPLRTIIMRLLVIAPPLVMGGVVLLVGLWACHWFRTLVDYISKITEADDVARKIGLSTVLYRLGLGPSVAHLAGIAVTSVIVLGTLLAAADVAGFTVLREFLRRTVDLAPRIMGVIVMLGGGLFIGDRAGRIVCRAADANHVKGSEALMRVTHGLVVFFSSLMALEYLGFDLTILTSSMNIILASIGLGCAIAFGVAFGMAGKDSAEKWIRDLTPRNKPVSNGHEVKMRVMR